VIALLLLGLTLAAVVGGALWTRTLPTRRAALVVALLSPVWLLSGSEWGMLAAAAISLLFLVVLVADAALLPDRGALDVERRLPATIGVGDRVSGAYVVRSSWARPVELRLFDAMPRGVRREGEQGERLRLAPDAEADLLVEVTGLARGRHELGPAALRVRGPLGLVQRTHRIALRDSVVVAPSITGVRRYRLLALQHRLRDAGIRTIRRRGEGTTFANLREYATGDDPRHIDWKATARRRKLITREFTVEQGQTVMIAVDAGRLMTQLSGPFSRFEYALSAALVLADVAVHSGDQVGLLLFDDELRAFVPPARGRGALEQVRRALIPAVPTMVEPDYAAAFRTLAARHRKRSLVVVFTDVIDTRASQALIAHTMRSAARHLPLVVALRNDRLADAASPLGRASSLALYESAAAEEMLSAREEALQRMRQAGVSVVDVSPHRMTAAVVNRYLEIKSRGAL
jgi:uncharacterized protein (DUF58 family)